MAAAENSGPKKWAGDFQKHVTRGAVALRSSSQGTGAELQTANWLPVGRQRVSGRRQSAIEIDAAFLRKVA